MPYIKNESRQPYNQILNEVVNLIIAPEIIKNESRKRSLDVYIFQCISEFCKCGPLNKKDGWKGGFNYLISKLCHELLKIKGLRYHNVNDIIGILRDCQNDMYYGYSTIDDWKDTFKYFVKNIVSSILREHQYCVKDEITGVLECCKLELYATVVRSYENLKSIENGPVSELDDDSHDRMR